MRYDVVSAVIESVQGQNPGPVAGITYTLRVNGERGPFTLSGIKPHNSRPVEEDEDDVDIRAASPGTHVIGVHHDGFYFFTIIEQPMRGPCDEG